MAHILGCTDDVVQDQTVNKSYALVLQFSLTASHRLWTLCATFSALIFGPSLLSASKWEGKGKCDAFSYPMSWNHRVPGCFRWMAMLHEMSISQVQHVSGSGRKMVLESSLSFILSSFSAFFRPNFGPSLCFFLTLVSISIHAFRFPSVISPFIQRRLSSKWIPPSNPIHESWMYAIVLL